MHIKPKGSYQGRYDSERSIGHSPTAHHDSKYFPFVLTDDNVQTNSENHSQDLEQVSLAEQTSAGSGAYTVWQYGASYESKPAAEYRCTHLGCVESFERGRDRDQHYENVHNNNDKKRPYKCTVPGCPAGVRAWKNQSGLRAHEKTWHGSFSCPYPSCQRSSENGFSSQSDLSIHLSSQHETQSYAGGPSTVDDITDQLTVLPPWDEDKDEDGSSAQYIAQVTPSNSASLDADGCIIMSSIKVANHIVSNDPSSSFLRFDKSMLVFWCCFCLCCLYMIYRLPSSS